MAKNSVKTILDKTSDKDTEKRRIIKAGEEDEYKGCLKKVKVELDKLF